MNLRDLSVAPPVIVEDGKTFRQNAIKKAIITSKFFKGLVLADDSGLEVSALGGKPGIRSARFARTNATDEENNAKLLKLLEKVPGDNRIARFVCNIALAEKGQAYLLKRQARDGSWQPSNQYSHIKPDKDKSMEHQWARTGLTSLALLALLGDGHTWLVSDPNKPPSAAGSAVEKGIAFLLKSQDAQNGRFGPAQGNFMYNHGLATLAVVEAAGLSGDMHLRQAAQKGVDLIQRTQWSQLGGWSYKDAISGNPDTSVSAWQIQALLTAREIGLNVDPEVLAKGHEFLKKVTDPNGMVRYNLKDRAVYSPPGVALMLRRWLGEKDTSALRALTRRTLTGIPRAEKGWGRGWHEVRTKTDNERRSRTFDPYAWYFGTYGAFFQGGKDWNDWHLGPASQTETVRIGLLPALLFLQDQDGAWRGNDNWTCKVGEVYSTALCVMALQVYYRIQ